MSVNGSELPVFDQKAFAVTASFLTPDVVSSYLRTISDLGEALLRKLGAPGALRDGRNALAEEAHTLAGSAGMLGFERLSVLGRSFEGALLSSAPEMPELAQALSAAVEATIESIRARQIASGHQAA